MPKKKAMVGWFDPGQLIATGIRVAISTVFGQFADKREALAAANPIGDGSLDECFDYAKKCPDGDFWFDFVADTGDGWTSTHAVADALAQAVLRPAGTDEGLPRGRLLVMGGDQVYPTASREEYENRLLYPFDEAWRPGGKTGTPRWTDKERPDLYAVPGNHDWYDGLKSFFHLFCRRTIKPKGEVGEDRAGRVIGGRQTWQTRSYFALKLPHGWWLWGTDSQLEGYIDQPQIDYFQFVAEKWMKDGDKLILCVGTPDWEYVDPKSAETSFATFSYLERLAGAVEGKTIRLGLVVTGDSHHYARLQETSADREGHGGKPSTLDYITCGGGGAFLHPTHHMVEDKKFRFSYPPPGVRWDPRTDRDKTYARRFTVATKQGTAKERAVYPGFGMSRWITLGNVLFPVLNLKYVAFLTPLYALFIWLLDFSARVSGRGRLPEALDAGGLYDQAVVYWRLVFVAPWPTILILLALGGYYYFSDIKNKLGRLAIGGLHAAAQAVAVTLSTCAAIGWTASWWIGFWGIAGSLLFAGAVSAFVSGFVMGLYLLISLLVFRRHWNEAYSSLGLTWFKGFLRMKITADGTLTVYPIGLRRPSSKPEMIEPAIAIDP